MSVSDEERHDAENTGGLVSKKLLEIMDLQADIDALLRDDHPTPFGSKNWQYACPEALQRLVAMTAIQFVLFVLSFSSNPSSLPPHIIMSLNTSELTGAGE